MDGTPEDTRPADCPHDESSDEPSLVPDARVYLDAIQAARDARSQAMSAARNLASYSKRINARDMADTAYEKATSEAWTKLGKSDHSLLAWIGNNLDRYEFLDEVETLLRHLTTTTTLDDLNELADELGWCGEWEYQRDRASDDGAFASLRQS